ncbi:MAG: hypothetical protein M3Y87_04400 [Myxococcota bacterium]|nr:hypothetical protein [Myxococcota bacterium]
MLRPKNPQRRALAFVLSIAAALVACAEPPVATTDVTGTIGDPRPVDLGTGPDRPRRRMDIDQLDAAMRRATGGLGWDDSSGRSQLERFSATLGVPDYVSTTTEDLEVSALFLKFLDDAARSTCDRLITRERDALPAERTFLVHAELDAALPADAAAIDANLAHLLLRFHGRRVAADAEELEPWRELFAMSRAASPDEPATAWRTTCVALIDHPDFYLY